MGFRNGKNNNVIYYIVNFWRYLLPRAIFQFRLNIVIRSIEKRADYPKLKARADYYNRLDEKKILPAAARTLGTHRYSNYERDGGGLARGGSAYFFDTYEHIRWFDSQFRWAYAFGDVVNIPDIPTIVKSRPIHGDIRNAVLLNLDKLRHFVFLNDPISYEEKDPRSIFYADMRGKPHRIDFMEKYFEHPKCLCGDVSYHPSIPEKWYVKKLTLYQLLRYRYILTIEGNDVATNLKWVMGSNSLAVMPRPKYETWFMEGSLIPDYHYIEIKEDYSDLIEKMDYYNAHPEMAKVIISNANRYTKQFQDRKTERDISILVMRKYFEMTQNKNK